MKPVDSFDGSSRPAERSAFLDESGERLDQYFQNYETAVERAIESIKLTDIYLQNKDFLAEADYLGAAYLSSIYPEFAHLHALYQAIPQAFSSVPRRREWLLRIEALAKTLRFTKTSISASVCIAAAYPSDQRLKDYLLDYLTRKLTDYEFLEYVFNQPGTEPEVAASIRRVLRDILISPAPSPLSAFWLPNYLLLRKKGYYGLVLRYHRLRTLQSALLTKYEAEGDIAKQRLLDLINRLEVITLELTKYCNESRDDSEASLIGETQCMTREEVLQRKCLALKLTTQKLIGSELKQAYTYLSDLDASDIDPAKVTLSVIPRSGELICAESIAANSIDAEVIGIQYAETFPVERKKLSLFTDCRIHKKERKLLVALAFYHKNKDMQKRLIQNSAGEIVSHLNSMFNRIFNLNPKSMGCISKPFSSFIDRDRGIVKANLRIAINWDV